VFPRFLGGGGTHQTAHGKTGKRGGWAWSISKARTHLGKKKTTTDEDP